ncbi:Carbonic anhydrase [Zancudomyces culisetae]|uniref:Carbonic anhydrase n=1 Tax=Zancudomyces culisetae TaxID=1213189 RepID=A0A1R1PXE5_ZANCU|nr:Carbonic anhydrase [Zancudomyces culisetae]|eukprot:OMH85650.1 Carbonic anhydrase [Zancudomyces culisetae]
MRYSSPRVAMTSLFSAIALIHTVVGTPNIIDTVIKEDKTWSTGQVSKFGVEYFTSHLGGQKPDLLYIGCSDSRVPSDIFMNVTLGEVFTHRNIGNSIISRDPNTMSVIDYALNHLNVSTIAITGHSQCGGVKASMNPGELEDSIKTFIKPITKLYRKNKKYIDSLPTDQERQQFLVELNVKRLVRVASKLQSVKDRWRKGLPLAIYGLVYKLEDGSLNNLNVTVTKRNQFDRKHLPALWAKGLTL